MQWARVKATMNVPLRRGAWYRVVSHTELEAVVTVEGKQVSVPRPYVEIRQTPPTTWTVLRNPKVAPRTPDHFRRGYLVCPGCRERVSLPAVQVAEQLCPRCSRTFPIAWSERYLEERARPQMRRILVIDDDAAVRSVLRRLLQRTGHEVLEAGDGAEGIALLQRRSFDLVILDTHMPGLGGLDTIPVLRKRWPTMKILAVSGTDRAAEVAIAERAIELGADQFLGKPFERSEVLRVIDTLLAQA